MHLTTDTLLHHHTVERGGGGGGSVQVATANCVSRVLAHKKVFVPKKNKIKFLPFYMLFVKKREKKRREASKLWDVYGY